jgi:hypothetical protein
MIAPTPCQNIAALGLAFDRDCLPAKNHNSETRIPPITQCCFANCNHSLGIVVVSRSEATFPARWQRCHLARSLPADRCAASICEDIKASTRNYCRGYTGFRCRFREVYYRRRSRRDLCHRGRIRGYVNKFTIANHLTCPACCGEGHDFQCRKNRPVRQGIPEIRRKVVEAEELDTFSCSGIVITG